MATIGDLVVNLSLNKRPFDSGISGAQGKLASAGAAMASIATRGAAIAGAAIAGLGLAATAAVSASVKRAMSDIDALAKSSDKLGIATQQLAGLQHAAGLAGVESAQLEKALAFMLKGTKDNNTSPAEQFMKIADSIAAMQSPAERVQTAVKHFGRAGADLIPLFLGGRSAIAAAVREAEKFGLAISRTDATQVEEANDAVSRMGAAWRGIGQTIAVAVAPAIEFLATNSANAIASLIPFIEGAMRVLPQAAIAGLDAIHGALDQLVKNFQIAGGVFAAVGQGISAAMASVAMSIAMNFQSAFDAISRMAMASGKFLSKAMTGKATGRDYKTLAKEMAKGTAGLGKIGTSIGDNATAAFGAAFADGMKNIQAPGSPLLNDVHEILKQQMIDAFEFGGAPAMPGDASSGASKNQLASGSAKGSKAALDTILKAQQGKLNNPQLVVGKQQLATLNRIERKLDSDGAIVGAFA